MLQIAHRGLLCVLSVTKTSVTSKGEVCGWHLLQPQILRKWKIRARCPLNFNELPSNTARLSYLPLSARILANQKTKHPLKVTRYEF